MKINKKLSAAIVLSLMMGVYGTASADSGEKLYGAMGDGGIIGVSSDNGCYVYKSSDPIKSITDNVASGNEYTVQPVTGYFPSLTWSAVYGGFSKSEDTNSNVVKLMSEEGTNLIIEHHVYGGNYIGDGTGNATGNKVYILEGVTIGTPSSYDNLVYGGSTKNGTVTGNEVNISGGTIIGAGAMVRGGYANDGAANGNKVSVSGGELNAIVYGGTVHSVGNVEGNEVEVTGSATKISDNVYGGDTYTGAATGNKVSVSGGEVAKNVYGGYVHNKGDAEFNEVTISGGTVGTTGVSDTGYVYGGYVHNNGDAKGNIVTISGSTTIYNQNAVIGGRTDLGTAGGESATDGNKVIITGGTVYGVYGGSSSRGNAKNNSVEISQASGSTTQIYGNVYGGSSRGNNAIVKDNKVTITGGTLEQSVYGGWTENGTANDNKVTITGGTIEKSVFGGRTIKGTANDNKVTITGGTINGSGIYGGDGSYDGSTVEENIVNITGGTFTNLDKVYGGHGDIATGNEVHIKNATINSSISNLYGGWGDNRASDNILVIEDSSIDSNGAFVAGGESPNGEANNNKVTIAGENIVVGTVVGGRGGKIADSNKVFITGGTITNNVYGGDATGSAGSANDNIVNFGINEDGKAEGIANVTGTVYGGRATTSTGNTLNVYTVGNKVGGLEKFQNMNFYIPKEANNGDVLVASTAGVNLTDVAVKAGFSNETALTTGDKVKLIASNVKVEGMNTESREKVSAGDFVNVDLKIYQGNDAMDQVTSGTATTLVAEIVGEEASESSKSLVETVAVGTAIIAEGGDLLAGAGLANAQAALAIDAEHGAPAGSATLFGAINANKSKIKSGSHVDVKGMNLNLGLVKEIKNNAGKFIVGPVVEYGKGKYDSYLDNGYHGEGDSHFVGGGLVAKQNNNNGMYYEGSVRAGKLMSDYKSNGGNYDSDSTYLAAHLGLGKVVKLNEKNSLDYYGKYFYSHQGSDDTTLHSALDHALHFDSVDSHRTRLGGRLNHVVKENNEVYIGFAWQHEFSSTARATIDGLGTPAPSCKGDTGIMELGWKVSETNKYDVDLGATGSIGKKKGAGINLSFNYKF